jgi:hypothetical protein
MNQKKVDNYNIYNRPQRTRLESQTDDEHISLLMAHDFRAQLALG